jgi:acyl carrier protein
MHEKTFVGQSETLAQIESKFYDETEAFPASSQQGAVESAKPSSESDLLSVITATLKTLLADELHMQESDIDEEVEFIDLGLDSIGGVTWLRKINEKYHTSIEATKVYSYPTLAQFSRHVKEEVERQGTLPGPSVAVATTRNSSLRLGIPTMNPALSGKKLTSCRRRKAVRFSSAPASQASHSEQAIAVIGMSGRYPQANNLEEFWNNIVQGRNCITQVPSNRWDVNRYYDPNPSGQDKISAKWLGVLDDIDCFDPLFFNISPQEAEYIDPQHRLFLLESCFHKKEFCLLQSLVTAMPLQRRE